ncbi:MAG: chromate transporter [Eubacteriales bacterium]|nr:chromate transporter [Eubacteriales bacterium]
MGRIKRLAVIFATMFKIGLFTFGGGWSIIAQIQNEFVDRRGWMTEEQIVDFMSLARSFPGIMIINMSVFCGCAMEGPAGAVVAAAGLSLPALLAIAVVTYFYSSLRDNVIVARMLTGVRSVVIPIIISASLKLKKTAVQSWISWVLLLAAFFVCVFTNTNKLLIVIVALAAGLLIWRGEISDDLS